MNDYLHSLRTGSITGHSKRKKSIKEKVSSKTSHRRTARHGNHHNPNNAKKIRRNPVAKTSPQAKKTTIDSLLIATINSLSYQVETLAVNHSHMAEAQKKTAKIMERQTRSMEKILEYVDKLSANCMMKKFKI